MKIAFIGTEKLPVPAVRGGAIQIYLEAIAPIIAKEHTVTMFTVQDTNLPNEETKENVHYIRVEEGKYLEQVCKRVKEEHFDVIHICNRPNWVASVVAVASEAKCVLSVHNEMFAYGKISEDAGRDCVGKVSGIVTVSDYIGHTISSRFPSAKSKIQTVYSGVDLQKYYPEWTSEGEALKEKMRAQLGIKNKKVILFVGRLSKVKGPHLLLQALPQIVEKHPDVMIVFVGSKWFGDDNVNNYVKHLYTLGAMQKEHVTFVKFTKPKDIPVLYTMSDVFVCSSQWQEPLARVHYEAMAAGLPIITSNRGGNPEVIEEGKNGYIIDDYENPKRYATVINHLLNSPEERTRLGKKGRKIAEEQFNWGRVVDNLLSVYKSVVSE